MIGYVRGIVTHLFNECCYVDVHGVGYRVYIAGSTRQHLQEGQEVTLFTYTNVREDAIQLYGFATEEEYDLFILLLSVSGIGPKVGLGILSGMDPQSFKIAVLQGQVAVLTKLPGIGKKSAERLVLELKDKISKLGATVSPVGQRLAPLTVAPQGALQEVSDALLGLGYSESEIKEVVANLNEADQDVSALLKQALVALGKGK